MYSRQLTEVKDGTSHKHQQAGHYADPNGSTNIVFTSKHNPSREWQNLISNCDITQIVTKLKISNCEKLKLTN